MKRALVLLCGLIFLCPQQSIAAPRGSAGLIRESVGPTATGLLNARGAKGTSISNAEALVSIGALQERREGERATYDPVRVESASRAPMGFDPHQLRVPDSAFAPASVGSNYDYPLDANGANTLGFRVNHWWDYGRLGLLTGYFELASATTVDTGDPVVTGWQASVFKDAATANRAFSDGTNRTSQWGPSTSCQNSIHVPCEIISYVTDGGGGATYTVAQVNNCLAEVKAASPNAAVFQSDGQSIATTAATVFVTGVQILQQFCTGTYGSTQPASAPTTKPTAPTPSKAPAPIQPGFVGNCFTFRGVMWGYAQQTSQLMSDYWSLLQNDYNNNYPPPSGGSTPGYTQAQFQQAQAHMAALQRAVWNKKAGTGLLVQVSATGHQYGITDISKPGPANWTANRLFGALYELRVAGHEEWVQAGTGLGDYQRAQMLMSNTWDALKQLPCH